MVTLRDLAQRARLGMNVSTDVVRGACTPIDPPLPGLVTYRIPLDGGQMRLHLRVEHDGSGVLFRDVTEVVHLNATATHIAKMALDGVPLTRAATSLQTRTRGASRRQIAEQAADIYRLVDVMRSHDAGCPTCALPDLPRTALFSTPVHAPYKADLALTYGCNNACPHCYNEPSRYPMASLNKQQWLEIVNRLHEAGVPHLILTGGEATLHPDLIDIIRYADQLGHVVGLNTNGRRLAHPPFAGELADAGLNHVQITLGSCRAEVHDAMMGARSFDQTVKGIENALNSRLHTITNTTLMRPNMDHAEEIVDFLYALGIRTFAMNGMIYSGGGFATPTAIPEEQMPGLLIRVRDHANRLGMRFLWYTPTEYCRMSPVELELGAKRCNAGEYSLCIEPNGDVLPCQSYYVTAGNILPRPVGHDLARRAVSFLPRPRRRSHLGRIASEMLGLLRSSPVRRRLPHRARSPRRVPPGRGCICLRLHELQHSPYPRQRAFFSTDFSGARWLRPQRQPDQPDPSRQRSRLA